MNLAGDEAARRARENAGRKYPASDDPRHVAPMLVPTITPSFRLDTTKPVFTIGSCFAREIEEVLLRRSVPLPLRRFSVSKEEWPYLASGLLNEYHPGTMNQRIEAAYSPRAWPEETAEPAEGGFLDLLMSQGGPVARGRLLERRDEIDGIYTHLPTSDAVVITLGFVEAWFDSLTGCWLNRMPSPRSLKTGKGRFRFVRFEYDEACSLMERAIARIVDHRPDVKILLSVSPVPLQSTFSGDDCVVANSHSKAVLRLCATRLTRRFRQVDYFPSFEMVTSSGPRALKIDLVHVKPEFIERVMDVMFKHYVDGPADVAGQGAPSGAVTP